MNVRLTGRIAFVLAAVLLAAGSCPSSASARQAADSVPRDVLDARRMMDDGRLAEAAEALESMLAKNADRPLAWQALGTCYHRMKSWDKAIVAHARASEFEMIRRESLYNLACAKAMGGDAPGALAALRKAVDAGFSDIAQLGRDADLESLRDTGEFREIQRAMIADAANAGPQAGPGDAGAIVDGAFGAKLAAAVMEAGRRSGFSGVVFVERGGKMVLHKGYGLADRSAKTAADANTVFSIGSITKSFTAAAVLALEQDGTLNVSDRISKHLAGVPADKQEITIHHLLTHSGGIIDFVDRPGEGGDFAPIDRGEAFKRLMDSPLLFAPGERSEYSNGGYVLLAMIVEAASGRTYQQYVRERLFQRAAMASSGFYGEDFWADGRVARGYGPREVNGSKAPNRWPAPTWALLGAGGIVSSASDLAAWMHAMDDDRVLNSAQRAKAFTAHVPLGAGGGGEGYGWIIARSRRGTPVRAVAGGNDFGFCANIIRYVDENVTLIATCNAGNMDALDPVIDAVRRAIFE